MINQILSQDKIYVFSAGLSLIFYFIIGIFFCFAVRSDIAPDEIEHVFRIFKFIELGSFQFLDPAPKIELGPLHVTSYLSYLMLSIPVRLFSPSFEDTLVVLRLTNFVVQSATILITAKLAHRIFGNISITCLSIVLLTSIPIFAFMSSFVSYDHFAILFCSLFYLYAYDSIKNSCLKSLLLSWSFLGFACLAKFSILPMVLATIPMALVFAKQNPVIGYKLSSFNFRFICTSVIFLLSLSLNLNLYGRNIIKYGEIIPSCSKVYGAHLCENNDYETKRTAFYAKNSQPSQVNKLSLRQYLAAYIIDSSQTTFGLLTHKIFNMPLWECLILLIIFLTGYGFGLLAPDTQTQAVRFLNFSALYYITIVFTKSYSDYCSSGYLFGVSLQGRYNAPVFPVIICICAAGLYSLLIHRNKILSLVVCLIVPLVGGSFLLYAYIPTDWYVQKIPVETQDQWHDAGSHIYLREYLVNYSIK